MHPMHGGTAVSAIQAVGKKWREPIKMRTDVHLLAGESRVSGIEGLNQAGGRLPTRIATFLVFFSSYALQARLFEAAVEKICPVSLARMMCLQSLK
jgi:hypothetical protein